MEPSAVPDKAPLLSLHGAVRRLDGGKFRHPNRGELVLVFSSAWNDGRNSLRQCYHWAIDKNPEDLRAALLGRPPSLHWASDVFRAAAAVDGPKGAVRRRPALREAGARRPVQPSAKNNMPPVVFRAEAGEKKSVKKRELSDLLLQPISLPTDVLARFMKTGSGATEPLPGLWDVWP